MRSFILAGTILLLAHSAAASTAPTFYTECASMTGRNATVIVPLAAAPLLGDDEIQAGDELAVYTPDGICAGAAVWTGRSIAIAVWETDPFSESVNGFEPGAPLAFQAYRASSGEVFGVDEAVEVAFVEPYSSDGIFAPDAIFVVDAMSFEADPGDGGTGHTYPFALEPAFPNPFHHSTTFAYSLPEDADVTLEVFDVLGRRVATLIDEFQREGEHSVMFLPPDNLATGILISRLRAGDMSAVTRLTHVR
jgi:hypothetical protein